MNLRLGCAASLILGLFASIMPLSAAYSDATYVYAHDLNRLCTSDEVVNKSWCEGFISSEFEIITRGPIQGIAACVPQLTTLPRAVEIVKKWLSDHPEVSLQSASLVVARALAEAFPCKK